MQKVSNNDAQNEFLFVMDQVCAGLGPVLITGMRGNAVLVSENDWRAMQHLIQRHLTPEVHESAVNDLVTPKDQRSSESAL